jgi:hypothetical protein
MSAAESQPQQREEQMIYRHDNLLFALFIGTDDDMIPSRVSPYDLHNAAIEIWSSLSKGRLKYTMGDNATMKFLLLQHMQSEPWQILPIRNQ